MLSKYEIGFIVAPDSNEEDVKKVIESVTGIITKAQGQVGNIDEWGVRKLAFPIKKYSDGYYVFIQCEVAGPAVLAVERRLRQLERVIRFITLRLDVRLQKANKLTKKWKKLERLNRKNQEAKSDSERQASEEDASQEAKNAN